MLCNLASGPAFAQEEHWQETSYIAESFFEIALNSKYRSTKKSIIKWQNDIHYYYDHRVPDQVLHELLTDLHMQQLSDITGLKIKQTKQLSKANLVVIFSKEATMAGDFLGMTGLKSSPSLKKSIRGNVCLAFSVFNASGQIKKATVLVAVDKAREKAGLVSCIVEELSEIMGLPNDSEKVYPSIFNDYSTDALLTGLDYVLLKILYDRRIKPGMNKQQLMPIVNKIISKLWRYKIIQHASLKVAKGGLYALLN
ncbi:MAG: DUF2927 domain-containing protein [Thiotrichaceae bacterium]|nr:DUF2927 domain-containing protein [Thiotrichaceae bacterium]